ncbi:hypothetical protein Fot_00899 [Forsythia ovata]|uniref:Uncharacterized protein n=1 Tax=Forsythia ovata TaxID=205694 RepID=A0ABD1X2B6_9LAMI
MAALANCFSWDANVTYKQENADECGENIDKKIKDIEEELHVQECQVADEMDDEIPQQSEEVLVPSTLAAILIKMTKFNDFANNSPSYYKILSPCDRHSPLFLSH